MFIVIVQKLDKINVLLSARARLRYVNKWIAGELTLLSKFIH